MESSVSSRSSRTSSSLAPTTAESSPPLDEKKAQAILDACNFKNLDGLRALAESPGGFLTDSLRQQACEYPPCHIYIALYGCCQLFKRLPT